MEAADFMDLAYGATLGLVYYRRLGDTLRLAWDRRIASILADVRRGIQVDVDLKLQYRRKFLNTGKMTAEIAESDRILDVSAKQGLARLDFFYALAEKKNATFPGWSESLSTSRGSLFLIPGVSLIASFSKLSSRRSEQSFRFQLRL